MNLRKFNKGLKAEYENTFKEHKPRFRYTFKLRHAFAVLILLLGIFLIGEHFSVSLYNKRVEKQRETYYSLDKTDFIKVESINDYQNIISPKKTKESILTSIFSPNFMLKGEAMDGNLMMPEVDVEESTGDAMESIPGNNIQTGSSGNQTSTNTQVAGIDEADYSKCDGTYIYSLYSNTFNIFDLEGNKIVEERIKNANVQTLYVAKDKIIILGNAYTLIYKFDGNKIELLKSYQFGSYCDSRLTNDFFYLIFASKFDISNEITDDLYYDGVSRGERIYSIVKFDLETNEFKQVDNLNSGSVTLYMSGSHIYLATTVYTNCEEYYQMTVTSVFDYDLNPVAAFRVKGTVLNQFSMDEHDDYFRIVTTNTSAETERLNAISVFSLSEKKLIGYLDEGIGLDRQIVKSVRYDDTTCYIVTYLNTDPLYEIDLSDPTKPTIVDEYKAPGYSSYLHTFIIDGEKYVLGIGYTDDLWTRKISFYKNDSENTQVGRDLIISDYIYTTDENILFIKEINQQAFSDHKALFIYQHNNVIYLGLNASSFGYYFFKIDVNAEEVITVCDIIHFEGLSGISRCYLVNDKVYITYHNELIIKEITK